MSQTEKKIYELKIVTYRWMRVATQITENCINGKTNRKKRGLQNSFSRMVFNKASKFATTIYILSAIMKAYGKMEAWLHS